MDALRRSVEAEKPARAASGKGAERRKPAAKQTERRPAKGAQGGVTRLLILGRAGFALAIIKGRPECPSGPLKRRPTKTRC
jgi:hypothetical protein